MGRLVDGQWSTEWYQPDGQGRFVRPPTRFRGNVRGPSDPPGDPDFVAAAGRYHLYVSLACPWAHRTLIVRALLGLERAIDVSVVDHFMGADGWRFDPSVPGATSDKLLGSQFLREVYVAADPHYTGRVTVPILWDRERNTIVNNESREIIRMLDHAFVEVAERPVDLCPPDLRERVDAAIDAIYEPINNGVYRAGFAGSQAAYDDAVRELFAALDRCEQVLGRQRWLAGDRPTEADVCLFTTLLRFDPVYHGHFKCNLRRIVDYPNLWGFVRELWQVPAIAATCDLDHIRKHYYASHEGINPTRIVAIGPALDYAAPHGRARVGGVAAAELFAS
ncbi:glutathione S-transferase family protein [Nannocystaceae bacterium ST9]